MKSESQNVKSGKQKEKKQKGCYWSWLEQAEIKTFEAWNNDRKK